MSPPTNNTNTTMETAILRIPDDQPCPDNKTMFQAFEWYLPADHQHWARLTRAVPALAALGATHMWIPPACKASWYDTNGYDVYDLYDLGEFDQKGSRHTKWGSKEELVSLTQAAARHGVGVLFDAVLNHKAAADFAEEVMAVRVDPKDRAKVIGEGRPEEVEVWTGYEFPGRGERYSPLKWRAEHFTGIDYDQKSKSNVLWRFVGKEWAGDVDEELGNYDYLMFADIDHNHPDVRRDMFYWAEWLGGQLKLGGLRVDAIKHYSARFLRDLIRHIDATVGRDWFIVGEYWRADSHVLAEYVDFMDRRISLFDVELCCNFSRISLGEQPDLRTVFDGTLCALKPDNAVTFVVNHDTQERQSLETPVAPFFLPLAYALILLRANTGIPCVFWSDLYGSFGPEPKQDRSNFRPPPADGHVVPRLMLARQLYAYGTQRDYFDRAECVGFTRTGHPSRSGGAGCAVMVNMGWRYATKRMCVGRRHAGERWTDLLGMTYGTVVVDEAGRAVFPVLPRGVAVWVDERAQGRGLVEEFEFDSDIFGFAEEDRRVAEEKRKANSLRRLLSLPFWLGGKPRGTSDGAGEDGGQDGNRAGETSLPLR
ncbi:alpha-amylase [Coniochaeta sp. 2T2.1]|nr:alpha-amylase [Coniochaeta sp. 2T2.1]